MYAEGTSVAANPQASINGSVANQAVQINQGSLSTQSFKSGNYCNGPILSFTPYYLVTESMASSFSTSKNFGGQISFSVPLDGGAVELCKEVARKELEKTRLDYELVRIKECIGIFKQGFMIRPGTPFYQVCADVVPIASLSRTKAGVVSSEPERPSSGES